MGWWKKMFEESVGNSEVRKEDQNDNAVEEKHDNTEITHCTTSVYEDLDIEPPETKDDVVSVEKIIKPLDLMKVEYIETPNKSLRKDEIKYIVLHHTGPGTFKGICNWLCNPAAKASAHYVVSNRSKIAQLANTKYKAWHAGISAWDGLSDINKYSIGIEIQNIGILQKSGENYYYEYGRDLKKYHGKRPPVFGMIVYPDGRVLEEYYVPYPEKQIFAVISLCKGLIKKYPQIREENIITHYQISPDRKNDPFSLDVDYIREMVF